MTEKRFNEEFLEEMNEIEKEKSERVTIDDIIGDKEVTIDLNELDINIQKEIIFKSDLNKWIEKKMDFYDGIMKISDGYNYVNARGHLDMLIRLKEWIKQR